jgi:hypothetical protein
LNDGSFRRVGGDREVKVNVRILSATHRNLEKMVSEGLFREDLFYRLNVLNVEVPPLRERGQDILLLARYFMQQACAQIQRPVCRLAPGHLSGAARQSLAGQRAAIAERDLPRGGDLRKQPGGYWRPRHRRHLGGAADATAMSTASNKRSKLSKKRCWKNSTSAIPRPANWPAACKPRTPPSPIACANTASPTNPEITSYPVGAGLPAMSGSTFNINVG